MWDKYYIQTSNRNHLGHSNDWIIPPPSFSTLPPQDWGTWVWVFLCKGVLRQGVKKMWSLRLLDSFQDAVKTDLKGAEWLRGNRRRKGTFLKAYLKQRRPSLSEGRLRAGWVPVQGTGAMGRATKQHTWYDGTFWDLEVWEWADQTLQRCPQRKRSADAADQNPHKAMCCLQPWVLRCVPLSRTNTHTQQVEEEVTHVLPAGNVGPQHQKRGWFMENGQSNISCIPELKIYDCILSSWLGVLKRNSFLFGYWETSISSSFYR